MAIKKINVNGTEHELQTTVANITDLTATAAELNIMDGVTATAAEINKLDGLTATTTELNYVDGVTSSIQTQLNEKLSLAGGKMDSGAVLKFSSTEGTISTSDYMGITYGRIASKGNFYINANHDNSTGQYAIITAGKGLSTSTADGLAVGASTLTWKDDDILTESNYTNYITVPTGAAANKDVDTTISAGSTSVNLPTSKAVAAFVEGKGYKTTDNNTTYTIATGDAKGQIKVTPSSGSAYNVSVNGSDSVVYMNSTDNETVTEVADLQSQIDKKVGVTAQTFTEEQKAQARANIGAAASSHNQTANTVTAGTFAGQVVANASTQTPGTQLLRNSSLVSTDTTPSNNGEICWTYG